MKHKNKDKEKSKYRSYYISFRKNGTIYRCSSSHVIGEECCWAYNPENDLSENTGGIVNAKTEEKAVEELKKRIAKLTVPPVGHINSNGKIMTSDEYYNSFD